MVSFGDMAQFAILGPMMEENLRRALLISRGNFGVFLDKPISLGFLIASALLLAAIAIPGLLELR